MRWTQFFRLQGHESLLLARSLCVVVLTVLLLSGLTFVPALCQAQADPDSRRILVFYNSQLEQSPKLNLFAEGFQMVANYHGLQPEYRDVAERPLPDSQEMGRYRFIVSSFNGDDMEAPDEYLRWLLAQFDAGFKILVLGRLGATEDLQGQEADPELLRAVYARLGLEYKQPVTLEMARLRYDKVAGEYFDYERALPPLPLAFIDLQLADETSPEMSALVRVKRAGSEGPGAIQVAYGPNGGFALTEYLYWMDKISFRKRWYIDPFKFLPAALGIEDEPALTPTTISGMRAAFSHVDGDAFMGFTEFSANKVCAEILRDEIFTAYDLPFTLSVIVAEVGEEYRGSQRSMNLAREIFAMANVEPASHTFSHPFVWKPKKRGEFEDDLPALHGIPVEGYTFDSYTEIVQSCRYITENLAPADKPCKVLLWSGDCDPSARQVALCNDNGLLNLNGGDSVKNADVSFFQVSGLYQWVQGQFQIFTGQANENILTNLWTGPFYGFRNTVKTMEETGAPRRLMPVNPYYHFYSGEKYASVQALKDVYDWMLKQELCHVYASHYIRMVQDFIKAEKRRLPAEQGGGWELRNYDSCASLRFPATHPAPDLARCENVLGYSRQEQGLFVHLLPQAERAIVRLSQNGEEANRKRGLPWLEKASGVVTDFTSVPEGLGLHYDGFGSRGLLVLAGLKPETDYRVSGQAMQPGVVRSDKGGKAMLQNLRTGALELREP